MTQCTYFDVWTSTLESRVDRMRPTGREHTPPDPPPRRQPDTHRPALCFRCQQPGHFARVCPDRWRDDRPDKNKPFSTPREARPSRADVGTNSTGGQQRSGCPPQDWRRKDNAQGAKSAASKPPVDQEQRLALKPTSPGRHSPQTGTADTDGRSRHDEGQHDHQTRIKELEEVVQQQWRQIEELSRRLETCQCGQETRASAALPPDGDAARGASAPQVLQ